MVAACTVGIISSIPGQTMGVGVFTEDLLEALSVSRLRLTIAYMVATGTSGFMLPLAGSLLDKLGSRIMIAVSAGGLGISLVAFSFSSQINRLIGGNSPLFATVIIALCYLAMRFWGQGCLTMTSRVAIGKWFNHRRGLATAISGVFVAFAFNGSPQVLNALVQQFGWRGASLMLAGIVGLGMTALGLVFYRDNPEACGLQMDGEMDEATRAKLETKVPDVYTEFTRRQAAKSLSFWVFSIGIATQSLIITAVTFHIASIGGESYLDEASSFAVFLPMSYFSIVASFGCGWLSDRINLKWLLIGAMFSQLVGIGGLMMMHSPAWRMLFVAGFGFANGALFGTLVTVTWPRFFGRKHLGAVSGLNMSILVIASAIGPVLFAQARLITGSYREVMMLCALMPAIITIASLRAENPQDRHKPDAAAANG
jgi:MFS family permease